jgi:hypothetical protein
MVKTILNRSALFIAVGVLLCLCDVGWARVIFQDDFEGSNFTALRGRQPQVGPTWRVTTLDREFAKIASFPPNYDRELQMTALPGSGTPYVYVDLISHAPIVQMAFDFRVAPYTNFGGNNILALRTDLGYYGLAVNQNSLGGSGGRFSMGSMARSPYGGEYKVSVTLFFETDEIEVWIDDLSTGRIGDYRPRAQKTYTPLNYLKGFDFEMPYNQTGSWYIDNFSVVTIPEPTGSALLYLLAIPVFGRFHLCGRK